MTLLEQAKEMFASIELVREVYDVSPKQRAFGSWGNLCVLCEEPIEGSRRINGVRVLGQELRIVSVRQPGTLWANRHEYWVHAKHWDARPKEEGKK